MWRSGRRLSRQGSVQSSVASSSFVATHFISLHSGQSGPVHANTQALRNDCISPLACTLSITRPSHFQRARYATAKTPPKNMALHMRLLQSLGRKLNVRKMDDWYRVTDNDLRAEGGAVLLESYGSLVSILETLYPNHPWDFKGAGATQVLQQQVQKSPDQTPQSRWDDLAERRQFFIDAAKKLGIKKVDDWASVTPHELKNVGGAGLLTRYNGFLGDALQDTFPTMSIDLSKFFLHQRSPAFWKDIATQRKFFQALGNRMGVRKPEDWYQISSQEIKDAGGAVLLAEYNHSMGRALRAIYPDHQWDLTKISDFRSKNSQKKEIAAVREWVAYAEKGLLIREMEDWYRATPTQVMKVKGSSVVPKLGGLPHILQKVYPDYPWDLSRFVNPSLKMSQPWVMEVLRRLFPRGTADLVIDYKHPDLKYPSGEPIELETYCPTHKFACEFKEPSLYSDAFITGLSRQEKRIEACKKLGITLIIIPYWWDREADSLAVTINKYLPEALPNPPVGAEGIPAYPTHAAAIQAKVQADDWLMLPLASVGKDPKGWWMAERVDGMRVYWDGTYLISQHGIRIKAPQKFLDALPPRVGLDGELWLGRGEGHRMVGVSTNPDDPAWENVKFCVYDAPKIEAPFEIRQEALASLRLVDPVMLVPVVLCTGQSNLESYFEEVRQLGGDGVLLRRANSDYDHGKSSNLIKLKVPQETEVRFVKKNERTCALICEQADGQRVNVRISAQMYNYDFVQSTVMTVGYDGLWESGQLRSPVFVRERDDLVWDNLVTSKKDKKLKLAGGADEEGLEGEIIQEGEEGPEGTTATGQDGAAPGQSEQAAQQATTQDEQEGVPIPPKLRRMQRLARVKEMQAQEEASAAGTGERKRGRPKGS